MRIPEYLSPSALKQSELDMEEYYFRYLCDTRTPKIPQTQPMSVGSAFDAYVKSFLHEKLFGKGHKDAAKYERDAIFESQVEKHNRDWALKAGDHVFQEYLKSGALSDMLLELQGSVDEPKFEFDIRGQVRGQREAESKLVADMVLLGKPDIKFVNSEGVDCIFDWKVNGYCGKGNTSPKPGYVQIREPSGDGYFRKGGHKDALPREIGGIVMNTTCTLDQVESEWATQISTYAWLLGCNVGSKFVAGIDQICGNGTKRDMLGRPFLRFASHRSYISEAFQHDVLARYQNLWHKIKSGHIFSDLSREDSDAKCQEIERRAKQIVSGEGDDGDWALNIARF